MEHVNEILSHPAWTALEAAGATFHLTCLTVTEKGPRERKQPYLAIKGLRMERSHFPVMAGQAPGGLKWGCPFSSLASGLRLARCGRGGPSEPRSSSRKSRSARYQASRSAPFPLAHAVHSDPSAARSVLWGGASRRPPSLRRIWK